MMTKLFLVLLFAWTTTLVAMASSGIVKSVKGSVEVRRGVTEEWKKVSRGEKLKPEDSMRTGKGSSAVITIGKREMRIPEQTIVDMIDFREMSQEEFLLKLAMEDVLRVPPRENDDIVIPSTTILHGTEMAKGSTIALAPIEIGRMQLQGTKVLSDNGFYATSVLRTKEVFRAFRELESDIRARLRVAETFERMRLNTEALREYVAMSKEDLPTAVRKRVDSAVERLKKE